MSQFAVRAVSILKIAAIIAPGKCWGALLDHLARNLLSTTRTGVALLSRSAGQARPSVHFSNHL